MVPITMTRMTSTLIPSLQSRPFFAFHRNLPNLLGRNARKGERRASRSVQSPLHSPKRVGTRTQELWTGSGLRHQGGGWAANRIHDPDVSRNTREGFGAKKQNKSSKDGPYMCSPLCRLVFSQQRRVNTSGKSSATTATSRNHRYIKNACDRIFKIFVQYCDPAVASRAGRWKKG